MFRILIAEDDANLRRILASTLEKNNYAVGTAADGQQASAMFNAEKYDLVITDVMMPKMDGNELCHAIRRADADVPVLMLTALEAIDDKEKSFRSGADDYLTKPFALRELLLRIQALLRRYGKESAAKLEIGSTVLDYASFTLSHGGEAVQLTKKEFLLLFKLLSNPGIIFSREQLMDEIWGYDSDSADRTVDVHINKLREKAVTDDYKIVTVRGLGYKAVLT